MITKSSFLSIVCFIYSAFSLPLNLRVHDLQRRASGNNTNSLRNAFPKYTRLVDGSVWNHGKPGDFVDAGHFIHDAAPYTECLVDHTLMRKPSDVEIGQHQLSPIHKQGRERPSRPTNDLPVDVEPVGWLGNKAVYRCREEPNCRLLGFESQFSVHNHAYPVTTEPVVVGVNVKDENIRYYNCPRCTQYRLFVNSYPTGTGLVTHLRMHETGKQPPPNTYLSRRLVSVGWITSTPVYMCKDCRKMGIYSHFDGHEH